MRGRVDWLLILLPKSSSSLWSVCVMAHFLGPPLQPLQLCAIPWPWLSPTPWQAKGSWAPAGSTGQGAIRGVWGRQPDLLPITVPMSQTDVTHNNIQHCGAQPCHVTMVGQQSYTGLCFQVWLQVCVCVCLLVRVHARMFMLRGNKISQKVNILVIYSCLLIWKKKQVPSISWRYRSAAVTAIEKCIRLWSVASHIDRQM